jgi:hypothetical protein
MRSVVTPGSGFLPSGITHSWSLSASVPGVSDIIASSGDTVTLQIRDDLEHILTSTVKVPGCSDKTSTTRVRGSAPPQPAFCDFTASIQIVSPLPPIGFPMQATCELDWGDNLVIIDPAEWTYEWWIEPDGNGTGISSTIAEVCNFTLGDDQWHTLRCRVTRIDCPMKVADRRRNQLQSNRSPIIQPCR